MFQLDEAVEWSQVDNRLLSRTSFLWSKKEYRGEHKGKLIPEGGLKWYFFVSDRERIS